MLNALTKTNLIRFSFHFAERTGNNLVLQEDLFPGITVIQILNTTDSIILKCSLLLVSERFKNLKQCTTVKFGTHEKYAVLLENGRKPGPKAD